MHRRSPTTKFLLFTQLAVVVAFTTAWFWLSARTTDRLRAAVRSEPTGTVQQPERSKPIRVEPLYDEPGIVSDDELAAVLEKVRPKFPRSQLKPNHVEHALRTWGVDATFEDPAVLSGIELRDVLVDHAAFLKSWTADDVSPLLEDRVAGVAVRYDRQPGGSVHHDHWLACLTEAGIDLDEPVFAPARRNMTVNDVLQESLRDFRLDERETEWSAMAFGYWLPPAKSWRNAEGREITFDALGRRLIRGHLRFGVCSGTHRVYSLMALVRLDDEYGILSTPVRGEIYAHLEKVRDLIVQAQFVDGHWSSNWSAGKKSVDEPLDEPTFKKVIATGHHLEWLAIAPKELHPSDESILRAADWIIKQTTDRTEQELLEQYTYYSHVGSALALWRGTRPSEFWQHWRTSHPFVATSPAEAEHGIHADNKNGGEPEIEPAAK